MTKINDYRHPATGMSQRELKDVVAELEALLAREFEGPEFSPWTYHVLEITAEQIKEAEDCLGGTQDDGSRNPRA